MPILSIAVPNRNQFDGLSIQEPSLRRYAKHLGVEILVSDNASDDESPRYLRENWRDFAKVSLLSQNIGFVGNLRNLAKNASGEWIWFLGAGDLPVERNLEHSLAFISQLGSDVVALLDAGVYKCISPYLGGVLYRRSALLSVLDSDSDEVWPHVSWSIKTELSMSSPKLEHTPLIHVEPWTALEDWHVKKSMFPFAISLNGILSRAVATSPNSPRLKHDLSVTQRTLLAWYVQDRMAGKVRGLNLNLLTALRHSGKLLDHFAFKILAVVVSLVPLILLQAAKRMLRGFRPKF